MSKGVGVSKGIAPNVGEWHPLFLMGSLFVLLTLVIPICPMARASSTPPVALGGEAAVSIPPTDSLRPALAQVQSALQQVSIDHWKLSRGWKTRLNDDANSIQQDLTTDLPALLRAAQQSPTALEPQLGVVHNVDALYEVLVRIATACDLTGGKADVAVLDNALQQLESSRKSVSSQLLQSASLRDQELTRFQATTQPAHSGSTSTNSHPNIVVVNNRVGHHKRAKTVPHQKTPVQSGHTGAANPGATGP